MTRFKILALLFFFPLFSIAQTNDLTLKHDEGHLPEGFTDEIVLNEGWIMGVEFINDSIMYLFKKTGQVLVFVNGQELADPLLDISEEIMTMSDHGLLGFRTHPDFLNNGLIYVYYIVDPYYLLNSDSPDYNPDSSLIGQATIGRLASYEVDVSNYTTILPSSRKILLGDEPSNGVPCMTVSHMGGTILFGKDTTLMLVTGDGSAIDDVYGGGEPYPSFAWDSSGLADGVIDEIEDVGAFRCQSLRSLNGKVLRLNPYTGEGAIGNPYYDPENPDSKQSKIYALGFRNPFRMVIKKGTGSTNKADGFPGELFVADVGNQAWEEVNHVSAGGQNFGWPIYEGMNNQPGYTALSTPNRLYENPLSFLGNCDAHYSFQALITDQMEDHTGEWTNNCDANVDVTDSIPVFFHERPLITWSNQTRGVEEVKFPAYDANGRPVGEDIGVNVSGDPFNGIAATAVGFYEGDGFPEEFRGSLFFADFNGWIKRMVIDDNYEISAIEDFDTEAETPIQIIENPYDGCLYYVSIYTASLRKICFGGNQKPVIVLGQTEYYDAAPLEITFDASDSYDPNDDSLSFSWDFGDGSSLEFDSIVTHTFTTPTNDPISYVVTLTVSDTAGGASTQEIIVSLNNTPPSVQISSFDDGDLYRMDQNTTVSLEANVSDNEHDLSELSYEWEVRLYHNTHFHQEVVYTTASSSFLLEPLGCGVEDFWYGVILKVSDPAGLSTTVDGFLYPDCTTLSVDLDEEAKGLFIYPNPTRDKLTLRNDTSILSLEMYNNLGQVVQPLTMRIEADENAFVDMGNLLPGSYFIRVETLFGISINRVVKF